MPCGSWWRPPTSWSRSERGTVTSGGGLAGCGSASRVSVPGRWFGSRPGAAVSGVVGYSRAGPPADGLGRPLLVSITASPKLVRLGSCRGRPGRQRRVRLGEAADRAERDLDPRRPVPGLVQHLVDGLVQFEGAQRDRLRVEVEPAAGAVAGQERRPVALRPLAGVEVEPELAVAA